ncbi:hypothetical protein I79_013825 [Cricetulus griseus]|uniref:Uncharacterized protein n=1 Tax=Cricetulus griseus TaxID=10029 RepID=G3HSJ2_CRIGR|nr:hypothetical protein I79_013825 [Cricetulus griseus]
MGASCSFLSPPTELRAVPPPQCTEIHRQGGWLTASHPCIFGNGNPHISPES